MATVQCPQCGAVFRGAAGLALHASRHCVSRGSAVDNDGDDDDDELLGASPPLDIGLGNRPSFSPMALFGDGHQPAMPAFSPVQRPREMARNHFDDSDALSTPVPIGVNLASLLSGLATPTPARATPMDLFGDAGDGWSSLPSGSGSGSGSSTDGSNGGVWDPRHFQSPPESPDGGDDDDPDIPHFRQRDPRFIQQLQQEQQHRDAANLGDDLMASGSRGRLAELELAAQRTHHRRSATDSDQSLDWARRFSDNGGVLGQVRYTAAAEAAADLSMSPSEWKKFNVGNGCVLHCQSQPPAPSNDPLTRQRPPPLPPVRLLLPLLPHE